MLTLLHVGCGPKRKDRITAGFNTPDWTDIRLDIDPSVQLDVTCAMTDMSAVASASVDAVFSRHNIEFRYPPEVTLTLQEFLPVPKPGDFLFVACPEMKSACALVADDEFF